ncbi:16495_t:CDS:1, partial [Funneliformis caledonium]
IQNFIDRLTPNIYENPISTEEYLRSKKKETIHQMITDEEIIKLMKEPEVEPNNEELEIPIISNYETLVALNQIIIYTKQKSDKIDFLKEQIQVIKKLRKAVEREEFYFKQQVTLNSYLGNANKAKE